MGSEALGLADGFGALWQPGGVDRKSSPEQLVGVSVS